MFHSAWPPSRLNSALAALAPGEELRADDVASATPERVEQAVDGVHVMHDRRAVGACRSLEIAGVVVSPGTARATCSRCFLPAAAISSAGTSSPRHVAWWRTNGQASGSFTSTEMWRSVLAVPGSSFSAAS